MENRKKLIQEIKNITGNDDFSESLKEFRFKWRTEDCESECLCGQPLLNTYFIEHIPTKKEYTIGSSCIKKFLGKKEEVNTLDFLKNKIVDFGEHKGKTYLSLCKNEPKYTRWALAIVFKQPGYKTIEKHVKIFCKV